MLDVLPEPFRIEIGEHVAAGDLAQGIHQVLFFRGAGLVQDRLRALPGRDNALAERLQEALVHGNHAADGLLERVDAGFEPLEHENSHQTAQVSAGPRKTGIGFLLLLFLLHVMPEAVAGIG